MTTETTPNTEDEIPADRGDAVDGADDTVVATDSPVTDSLDDATETEDEKAEREAAEAEADKKRKARIPLSRHEEILNKARAREQALADEVTRLKGGQKAAAVQDAVETRKSEIEALQDKYEDLILDGKKDDARTVRRQIDAMRDELIDYQSSVKANSARVATLNELSYNAELARVEATYPALNPDNEAFNEEAINEVAFLVESFVKSGAKRSDALAKAAKYVLGAPTAKAAASGTAAATQKMAEDARKRAAVANGKQPPNAAKVGMDSDRAGAAGVPILRPETPCAWPSCPSAT